MDSVFFFFCVYQVFVEMYIDGVVFAFAVTAVESGTRALQYLGLDGEKSSMGIDVCINTFLFSSLLKIRPFGCMLKAVREKLTDCGFYLLNEMKMCHLILIFLIW